MVRVTRPGGTIYLSFTAWYSPWGGHETAPWHYLGAAIAPRCATNGTTAGRPGNRFGSSLFACHVGPTLRLARAHPGVEVVDALPRYYPDWMRWVIDGPGACARSPPGTSCSCCADGARVVSPWTTTGPTGSPSW